MAFSGISGNMVLGAFLLKLLVRLTGLINLREGDIVSISNSVLF